LAAKPMPLKASTNIKATTVQIVSNLFMIELLSPNISLRRSGIPDGVSGRFPYITWNRYDSIGVWHERALLVAGYARPFVIHFR
jgi:hypothetical protein